MARSEDWRCCASTWRGQTLDSTTRQPLFVMGEVLGILRRCAGQEYRGERDGAEPPVRIHKINNCIPQIRCGDVRPRRIRAVKAQTADAILVRGRIGECDRPRASHREYREVIFTERIAERCEQLHFGRLRSRWNVALA